MLGQTFVVVWEGVDGAGKTTLMKETSRLISRRGYTVEHYKTPSNSETGKIAKSIGNSPDVDAFTRMLLFLANTSADSKIIKNIIREKKPNFYFIDRYYLCSIVYGLALIEKHQNKTFSNQHLEAIFKLVEELGDGIFIKPDYYVIVSLEDEEARMRRVMSKDLTEERRYELDTELQQHVKKHYRYFMEKQGNKALWVENSDNLLYKNAESTAEHLIIARSRKVDGK
ncbi:MAG TPA: hypothetical protein EYH45_02475 [Candidatus Caldiarchaeum subterraneum]|uniref:Thymidylate kinase-like domain-containing protein n=1 Tax=Caldiarchaeum subterraneum TaxID=311458 RepID=A0A832ZV42_CALS0|nr:hypothetical protein [Candidatus Caldarchaeum subterraneum]